MHNDEVIWQVLGNHFCSFKVKIENNHFCRNQYNVTGQCNRVSCPLANGYYGTIIEHEGSCYLCLKTIERAHLPKKMWEFIKLSSNYQEALTQINTHMKNIYKEHQINRCKQRLTRLRQTLLRMRKMMLTPQRTIVPIKKKTERREATREKKAETAARLETSIESELLNRLKQGVYGDIYNYDKELFEKVLDKHEEAESDLLTHENEDVEFVEDDEDIEDVDEDDMDEAVISKLKKRLAEQMLLEEDEETNIEDINIDTDTSWPGGSKSTDENEKSSIPINQKSRKRLRGFPNTVSRRKGPRVEVEYEDDSAPQLLT